MKNTFENFIRDLSRLDESKLLHEFLVNAKISIDFGDILRWQWVWAISAFDKFMHDLVRQGMLSTFRGERPATKSFEKFSIHLKIVMMVKGESQSLQPWELTELFNEEIVRQHAVLSFQNPDKVSNALSLIWAEEHKWQQIAKKIALSENEIKESLNNIVTRRNCIVHEGDNDPTNGGKNSISASETEQVIVFLKKLGQEIYSLVCI